MTQQLNPLIMPPDILHLILEQVVDRIKTNARLRLSENPTGEHMGILQYH